MIGRDARSPDPRAAGYFERSAGCAAAPQSPLRWAVLPGALALLFTPVLPAVAAESPFSPGLFEALHNHTEAFEQDNLALWTPMLVGGIGSIRPDQGGAVRYGNLAVTSEPMSASGRQVLGMYGFVQTPGSWASEGHGEYRWSVAADEQFALGGGLAELDNGRDYGYAKFGVRSQIGRLHYLGYLTANTYRGGISPGFYSAVHNDQYFAGGELSADRHTIVLGYAAEKGDRYFRPAFEYFAFDRGIGQVGGANFTMISTTLRFADSGYFTVGARLGRALGPSGVQLTNPVGFLLPTWNRLAGIWEIGRLLNLRYQEFQPFPGAPRSRVGEAVLFPADLFAGSSFPKAIFAGGAWQDDGQSGRVDAVIGLQFVTPRVAASAVWQGRSTFTLILQIPWRSPR